MKINRTSMVALIGSGLAAVSLAFAGPAAARGDGGGHPGVAPGPSHEMSWDWGPGLHSTAPTHLGDPVNPNGGLSAPIHLAWPGGHSNGGV